jgi:hypothetical protein
MLLKPLPKLPLLMLPLLKQLRPLNNRQLLWFALRM